MRGKSVVAVLAIALLWGALLGLVGRHELALERERLGRVARVAAGGGPVDPAVTAAAEGAFRLRLAGAAGLLWLGGTAGLAAVARRLGRERRVLERLQRECVLDELTGLRNRRGFIEDLRRLFGWAGESERERAEPDAGDDRRGAGLLFFVDLDGLKMINDFWGHEEGDRAMVRLARALEEAFSGTAAIARLGGDEFVALCPAATAADAGPLRERLRSALDRANASVRAPYRLSASVGVAEVSRATPSGIQDILRRADREMYARKPGRRSRVVSFEDPSGDARLRPA